MNKIGQISLLCALLVVLIHVPKAAMDVIRYNWFIRLVPQGYCSIAVPFFFIFSGYFLGRHAHERGWWQMAMIKRLRSLVVPYICWCGLMFGLMAMLVLTANLVAGRSLIAHLWPAGFLSAFLKGFGLSILDVPLLIPFWYVRALILFVFVSAMLNALLKYKLMCTLLLIFLAGVVMDGLTPDNSLYRQFVIHGIPLCGLAYFALGFSLGAGYIKHYFADWSSKRRLYLGLACLILSAVLLTFSVACPDFRLLMHGVRVLALMGVWLVWPNTKIEVLKKYGWLSFAIFAIHPFVITMADLIGSRLWPTMPWTYLIYGILCAIVSTILGILTVRIVPAIAGVLLGGRR